MRKAVGLTLALIICMALMTGCGSSEKASASPKPSDSAANKKVAAPQMLTIKFTNASSYIFNEIYISPTAANDMGDDLLGSTSVLKSNGSVDVEVPAYDYENYDIEIIDEDKDRYSFTRVPLADKSEVSIYFGENALVADVVNTTDATVVTVEGKLYSADGSENEAEAEESPSWIEFNLINATDLVSFTEAYFMPEGTNNESEFGYNHLASTGQLRQLSVAQIGVDNHVYFDALFVDDDGDQWYYPSIFFDEGCHANVTFNNGAYLEVQYTNGLITEYEGSIY